MALCSTHDAAMFFAAMLASAPDQIASRVWQNFCSYWQNALDQSDMYKTVLLASFLFCFIVSTLYYAKETQIDT